MVASAADRQSGRLRLARDIVEHLRFARLVAYCTLVGFDPRSGIHIGEAARKQRDQFAVDVIDTGAHVDHRFALFGKFDVSHGRSV